MKIPIIILFVIGFLLTSAFSPNDAYAAVDTWTNATTTNVGSASMRGVSMSDASNGVAVGTSGTIVFTTNGGVDWTAATTTDVSITSMLGVSMSDASNGVAVGSAGQIVFTTNGGVDWRDATTTNVSTTAMRGVSMSDASNGVAVGASGEIVFTTNGGVDWRDATTTNVGTTAMWGVSMSDASNGVAVGNSGKIIFTASSEETKKSSSDCYDCEPPTLQQAQIQIDSAQKIIVTGDSPLHITANVGDKVMVILNVTDNKSVDTFRFAGLYTNYQEKPNDMNTFYANNYDKWKHVSTSFYEWNVRADDVAYDYDGTVSWSDNTPTVVTDEITDENYFMINDGNVLEYFMMPFTFTMNDSMETSQITAKIYDASGNRLYETLPVTLEIIPKETVILSDAEEIAILDKGDVIVIPSEDTTPLLNEPVLFTVLSQWSGYSQVTSDDAEMLSVMGLQGESLPAWTKNLGEWVIQEKLDVSELITAIQYVHNNQ